MATKFILGCITGAYVATQYNFKPYFDLAENQIRKQLAELKKIAAEEPPPPKEIPSIPSSVINSVRDFFSDEKKED